MNTNVLDKTNIFDTMISEIKEFSFILKKDLRIIKEKFMSLENNFIEINYLNTFQSIFTRINKNIETDKNKKTNEKRYYNLLKTLYFASIVYHNMNLNENDEYYPDTDKLISEYPQFIGCKDEEKNYLLRYRNALVTCLDTLVNIKLKKIICIDVSSLFEKSNIRYV